MSSSRRLVLAALPLALAGCFRPMLASNTAASELRGQVDLPRVDGRLGRELTIALERQLGRPVATPPYRLEVERELSERGVLVAEDNAITRVQLTAIARWRLYRRGEIEPVDRGVAISEAGFDETASLFASRTTRRDVEERLARDLADRIATRLLARADRYVVAG
ncbi:MAG: LPS assembly lipoprotein LptE [Pseudomonadota bacterium]